MQSPISRADLQTLLHEADGAARRLIRKLRLSKDDLADVRQELLVDVIARLPAFDPSHTTFQPFALSSSATANAGKMWPPVPPAMMRMVRFTVNGLSSSGGSRSPP